MTEEEMNERAMVVHLTECASAAYEPEIPGRLIFQKHQYLHDDQKGKKRGFIGWTKDYLVISVKGTKSVKDFVQDAKVAKVPFLGNQKWMVHKGVNEEFLYIWPKIMSALQEWKGAIKVCGHSLGAGIGALVAFAIREVYNRTTENVLIGCLKVGTAKFAAAFNERCPMTWRIVLEKDLVPQLPVKLFYSHFDHLFHISKDGFEIHPVKGFFRRLWNCIIYLWTDLDGEGIEDHDRHDYVRAVLAWSWRSWKPA